MGSGGPFDLTPDRPARPATTARPGPGSDGRPPFERRRSKARVVRWGLALAGATAAVALALRLGPAAALGLGLAIPASEPWLGPLAAPVTREGTMVPGARPLPADLYRPATVRGALVLVHGLSSQGRRQADLARLARLLAGRGQLVLVPHLDGLAAFRLGGQEVADIRAAIAHLRSLRPAGPVGIAGFSFGAGPALLAAADTEGLDRVGAFGGYADLTHVIGFITTGVHWFDGRRHVQPAQPYNRWKLLALLAGFVSDGPDRARLDTLATRKLADPGADTAALEASLGPVGRAVHDLATSRREDALPALLAALPPGAREALDRLSPLPAVPRLRARLLLAHGTGDDSIPFTETLRLAAAVPRSAPPPRVALLATLDHTGQAGPAAPWQALGPRLRDAWAILRLADDLIRVR